MALDFLKNLKFFKSFILYISYYLLKFVTSSYEKFRRLILNIPEVLSISKIIKQKSLRI